LLREGERERDGRERGEWMYFVAVAINFLRESKKLQQ
jgi:hypothetical protein